MKKTLQNKICITCRLRLSYILKTGKWSFSYVTLGLLESAMSDVDPKWLRLDPNVTNSALVRMPSSVFVLCSLHHTSVHLESVVDCLQNYDVNPNLAKIDPPPPCQFFSDNLPVFLSLNSPLVNFGCPPPALLGCRHKFVNGPLQGGKS